MTLIEFNKLQKKERSNIVWEWAYYISKRSENRQYIILFMIEDFFAEVYINISDNTIEKIIGITRCDLHKDFLSSMHSSHPFIKSILSSPGPPFFITAA